MVQFKGRYKTTQQIQNVRQNKRPKNLAFKIIYFINGSKVDFLFYFKFVTVRQLIILTRIRDKKSKMHFFFK